MSWSHQFDEDVATKYGVSPAVMIAAMQRWIRKNRSNEKHSHDGRTWTYNSWRGWAEQFPFWTPDQVRRILEKLIELKVLRVGNFNKTTYDRTMWYAFEDETVWVPFGKSAEWNSGNPPNGIGKKAEPIPPSSTLKPPEETKVSTPSDVKRTNVGRSSLPPIVFDWGDGVFEGISDHEAARWQETYPACDVELEIGKAAAWLVANPKKRKKNYRRFLTNWLAGQQEKGGSLRARAR